MTTNNTSRRSLLKASVAIAGSTVAVPALAVMSPDAELLRLGVVFGELERQFDEAQVRWKPYSDFIDQELEKLRRRGPCTDEKFAAIWAQADEQFPTAKPTPSDIQNAMDEPCRAIMALPATTLAGLAVKARVARESCSHMYLNSWTDRDWDHKTVTSLIDAVLAMEGMGTS